jgi:hypothetical protein
VKQHSLLCFLSSARRSQKIMHAPIAAGSMPPRQHSARVLHCRSQGALHRSRTTHTGQVWNCLSSDSQRILEIPLRNVTDCTSLSFVTSLISSQLVACLLIHPPLPFPMASPAKRQASVHIEEPQQQSEPPRSPAAIPAAAAKQSPKDVAKQLLSSIPAKEMDIFAKWKVKQVRCEKSPT